MKTMKTTAILALGIAFAWSLAIGSAISSGGPGSAGKIIWVSDGHESFVGAEAPDDQDWVDLLRSEGYTVDYQPPTAPGTGYWRTLDTARLAALEAADLIIVSRDTSSANHANDTTEVTQWNSVKTPLILLQGYLAQSSRWIWMNSANMGARQAYFTAKAVDATHPVFAGVALDSQGRVTWLDQSIWPGYSSYINTADAGNGKVIAVRPDNNYVVIAEWSAGTPFYAGSTQTPGDKRMLFCAGTEQTPDTGVAWGVYDLTADGTEMFLNAVAYMMGGAGQPADVSAGLIAHWKLDETSGTTVFDSAAQNDGLTYGGPVWQPTGGKIDGALKLDGVNDYVQLPIGSLIKSLTSASFATWVNWSGVGTWIRIFDFGSGTNAYMCLTPRTDTGLMCFAITNAGNTVEDRATAPQVLVTGWHHVAVTIDAASKTYLLYLDGQVAATKTSARYTPSSLGTTTQNWLGRCQWVGAPYFSGALDDFRIYNRVLSQAEVAQLAGTSPGGTTPTSPWMRAAYWDSRYPSCWAGDGQSTRDALQAAGYTVLNADQLKSWMDARIADKQLSVVVFCKDVAPDTVVELQATDCTLRKYLDAGGKIVWYADIPFGFQGHANGTSTSWDGCSSSILGVNSCSAPWGSGQTVTLTADGTRWGLTETWTSQRPVAPYQGVSALTLLATDGGGHAAAWVKHYVAGDTYRGFVRLQDTPGQPLVADIMRVAEYGSSAGGGGTASLTVEATQYGSSMTQLSVTGSGFAGSASGQVFIDLNANGLCDSSDRSFPVTTRADGTFSMVWTVAFFVRGEYKVGADIPVGPPVEAWASLTTTWGYLCETPTIELSPESGPRGTVAMINACGFQGLRGSQNVISWFLDENGNGKWDSGPEREQGDTLSGVHSDGTWSYPLDILSRYRPGSYTVYVLVLVMTDPDPQPYIVAQATLTVW
ncbi:MAG: LamG domain-containing protein [Sedimentisphaerales bacterium]|nr:LamG domain-containing protein [Sedimentisphaerales bacterium]